MSLDRKLDRLMEMFSQKTWFMSLVKAWGICTILIVAVSLLWVWCSGTFNNQPTSATLHWYYPKPYMALVLSITLEWFAILSVIKRYNSNKLIRSYRGTIKYFITTYMNKSFYFLCCCQTKSSRDFLLPPPIIMIFQLYHYPYTIIQLEWSMIYTRPWF